jgi:hypothetical protein
MPLFNVGRHQSCLTSSANRNKVTLKENASPDELQKAKDKAKSDGGEIKHEFTLIKGFT